jgi:hypothetical protein
MSDPVDSLSRTMLTGLHDSEVLVLPGPYGPDGDALAAAWKAARDEAMGAYGAWRYGATREAFAVYRAAADREDAAAAALASRAAERRRRRPGWAARDRAGRPCSVHSGGNDSI